MLGVAQRYPRRSFLSIVSQWGSNSKRSRGSRRRPDRRRQRSRPSPQLPPSDLRPWPENLPSGQYPPANPNRRASVDPVVAQLRRQPPPPRKKSRRRQPPPNRRRVQPPPRGGSPMRSANVVPMDGASPVPQPQNVNSREQPHPRPKRRVVRRHRPVSPMVYGARLLILGIGIGVISGTVLSILNSLGRSSAGAMAEANLASEEMEAGQVNDTLPLSLQFNREMRELKTQVQTLAEETPEIDPGLMVLDLQTGNYVGLGDRTQFPAASTIKVPILVAFFQAVDAGEIRLDEMLTMTEADVAGGAGELQYQPTGSEYTALEVATQMIVISDNTATNMIIDRLGGAEILNRKFRSWGLQDTAIRNPLPDLDGTNTTTPRDLVSLMAQLHQGGLLSMTSRDRLLRIMVQTENDSLLPAGLGRGAIIAHKTGTLRMLLGDVGLVDLPNGKRYILAVLASRPDEDMAAQSLIQEMSRTVYEYFDRDPAAIQPEPTPLDIPLEEGDQTRE
ncbi:serine hydrolase [Lyngbya sp. CCY1209]|uniref:serine hydrolase n=1 Tax=Lyngbya sp. CCY1209 TaxID=2886103 RepID=UPI002D211AE0|nr:serine hydrolase [Lyngbya sp. CCY1209]MEB3885752.1 class A beta-lactamase-related serine hydrolase [Lyngbya sp. CCY1209]